MDFEQRILQLTSPRKEFGLDNFIKLMDKLGNPQNNIKFIHISGTNGKGSTCAMLSNILIESGYSTGMFTSPFVHCLNEEFKINDVQILDEELLFYLDKLETVLSIMDFKPTHFELRTAIAFQFFYEHKCDVAILEVGVGGMFDATNIIKNPQICAISKISLDHTFLLGDTVEKITHHKAGIIKQDTACVLSIQEPKVQQMIYDVCYKNNAQFITTNPDDITINSIDLSGTCIDYKHHKNILTPLIGTAQVENLSLVLNIIDTLKCKGYKIDDQQIKSGLLNTKWHGRFEILRNNPPFILDASHNLDGINTLVDTLQKVLPSKKFTFILAFKINKDYFNMINKLIPLADKFIAVSTNMPDSLSPTLLQSEIKSHFTGDVLAFDTIEKGVKFALKNSSPICCMGSIYMFNDVKKALNII